MSALKPGDNITELWQSCKIEDLKILEGATVALMAPKWGGSFAEVIRGTLWREPMGLPHHANSWCVTLPTGHVFDGGRGLTGVNGFWLKLVEPSA